MRSKRKFAIEFKQKVVEEVNAKLISLAQATRQYELSATLIYRWMDQYEHGKLQNKPSNQGALENQIAELERKVGQQAMEIDLLKKARSHYQASLNEKSLAPMRKAASNGGVK